MTRTIAKWLQISTFARSGHGDQNERWASAGWALALLQRKTGRELAPKRPASKRKTVTVLCDVTGSTALDDPTLEDWRGKDLPDRG